MKKELIIILTALILLTGRVEALTLTQKLGNESIETTVEKGERVTMTFTSKIGFQFKNWEISGITGLDETDSSISFSMPNNNVTIEGKYDGKYIITFNNNTGTGSMTNLEIPAGGSKNLTKNTFTKDGHTFKGWSETIDGDVKYNDETSIKPTENMTLYAVWEEVQQGIAIESIPVGAYVEYNPIGEVVVSGSDSGTGADQKFNTASNPYTGGWKVLYNDNGKITLISAESVGSLTLGKSGSATDDETNSALSGGKIGYAKAIYTLNEMCRDFATGQYAVRDESRCLGYNGTAVENLFDYTETDVTKITLDEITHANIRTILGSQTGSDIIIAPWGGSFNSQDLDQLEILGDIVVYDGSGTAEPDGPAEPDEPDSFISWWLASRRLYSYGSTSYFSVRRLNSNGSVSDNYLYGRGLSGDSHSVAGSNGVRPVIVLESGLKVASGDRDGTTLEKAYILTK